MSLLNWIKSRIYQILLKRRFPDVIFYDGASLDQTSSLGRYCVLFNNVALIESSLGSYSYIQSESKIINTEIGSFCSIAGNVVIGLAGHPMHMVSTSPVFYDCSQPLPKFLVDKILFSAGQPRTVIGSDVWIGQGVMIKAGVSIGVGAVIGAASVVTKDIPPYSIAVGNPCRVIKQRFPRRIVDSLIATRWWERSDENIKSMADLFVDPEAFIEKLRR